MVVWQLSQVVGEAMWLLGLPGAVLPLWQVAQADVMPPWSIDAGTQPLVVWQSSQVVGAGTWLLGLPGAVLPL